MSWLRRLIGSSSRPATPGEADALAAAGADPFEPDAGPALDDDVFVCSTCGRIDLPEAGGWDSPICLECDAAINFEAIEEVEITQDW